MDTLSALPATPPDGGTAAGCFHCGEPLPPTPPMVEFDGAPRPFCCPGCAQAAAFIRDQGLGDYYQLRQREGSRVAAGVDCSVWDRADLLAEHSRALADGSREITVLTDGMHCAACAWLIDRALRREPAVDDVQANAITGRIRLRWQPGRQHLSALLSRLTALGYTPQLAPGADLEAARLRERRQMILRLGVAGLGMLQAMMFAEALYLDFDRQMADPTRDFFRWIAMLVSTPVVFWSGWPFIAGMLREFRLRRLGMDTPIAGSVLLAWAASVVETIRGGAHVWYDAAVMFVFLLLAARAIEQFARRRANAVVEQLGRARPVLARRVRADGVLEAVPLAALEVGDVVQVAAGDAVPADGRLLDTGEFDESLLTGESRAVVREAGDTALAGSHALSRPVRIEVTGTGQSTRLAQLVRLVDAAQNARPQLARAAESLSGRFVVGLLLAAAATFAIWLQVAPERAFEVALAVLVVSCPCALSLAVPAGLAVAHGTLARIGVLSLSPDAIDSLARVDTVLLDKTGTLTEGRPRIVAEQACGALSIIEARSVAAALERASGHPLAAAFVDGAEHERCAASVEVHAGLGVSGTVGGREFRLGRADFAAAAADDGAIWLGDGRHPYARFELSDSLRPDAATAIEDLQRAGIRVEIASGDAEPAVAAAARALGVSHFQGRMSPEAKLQHLRDLQADGRCVAMLGDGINDAPVLAGADVSLAMASGAAVAHRAADMVLTGTRLERLPQALAVAARTRRVLRQNLAWALAYNAIAMPFAATGLVTPWLAALGMAASSLLVTFNALRLARVPAAANPAVAATSAAIPSDPPVARPTIAAAAARSDHTAAPLPEPCR